MADKGSYTDIQGAYEKGTSRILNWYLNERLGGLKNDATIPDDERRRQAWDSHKAAKEMLQAATVQRNEALEKREGELKRKLFGGPSSWDKEALASYQAALSKALDHSYMLDDLLNIALKSGDRHLARAVFTVAEEVGGEPEVVQRYLEHNEEAREHYRELISIPDKETRERAVQRAPEAIAQPTDNMVRPTPEAFERLRQERMAPPLATG